MLRLIRHDESLDSEPESFPFPADKARDSAPLSNEELAERMLGGIGRTADDVLASLEHMSQHIDELAREFNCLGDFDDDDDDRPRAA